MGYIDEMRKLVGHRPMLLVGAGVLVVDEQGWLLMHRRSDNGAWGIPGGAVEPGERVEETACREVEEETGVQVGDLSLFNVFSGPDQFYEYPNGDQVHNVSVVYLARPTGGELRSGDESTEVRFFAPGALPEPISPPVRPVIEAFLKLLGAKS